MQQSNRNKLDVICFRREIRRCSTFPLHCIGIWYLLRNYNHSDMGKAQQKTVLALEEVLTWSISAILEMRCVNNEALCHKKKKVFIIIDAIINDVS